MIQSVPVGRLTAVAVLTLAGCTPRATADELSASIVRRRDLDVPARLLGCAGYTDPGPTAGRMQYVTVGVLVGPDGRVQRVGGAQLAGGPAALDTRISDSARARAEDLAWGCAFRPGELGGEAVATQEIVSFRLAP